MTGVKNIQDKVIYNECQTETEVLSEEQIENIDNKKNSKDLGETLRAYELKILSKITRFFDCPYENCPKKFTEKINLENHIKVHTGERPYKCTWEKCQKSFISHANLKSHLNFHLENKPFKCSFKGCTKAYLRFSMLQTHERTHTGLRPYDCPYEGCGKKFNEKGNLKTHLRIHTGDSPYLCTFEGCNRAFKAKGHLNDHLNKHLKLKPHECLVCHKMFERLSTLKIHQHIHIKDKKYECPVCKKQFKEKGNMKTHIKIHERKHEQGFFHYLNEEINKNKISPSAQTNCSQMVTQVSFIAKEKEVELIEVNEGIKAVEEEKPNENRREMFNEPPKNKQDPGQLLQAMIQQANIANQSQNMTNMWSLLQNKYQQIQMQSMALSLKNNLFSYGNFSNNYNNYNNFNNNLNNLDLLSKVINIYPNFSTNNNYLK